MRKGLLIVISGPSGAGKGAVIGELKKHMQFAYSVSATTRSKRDNEKPGVNYRYVTEKEFDEMINNGEMLEYVTYNGSRYGTPKKPVEENLARGEDMVLEIETVGAGAVKKLLPECVSIFILPPSKEELWSRLTGRKTETEESAKARYATGLVEIEERASNYDYIVVNNSVTTCMEQIMTIIAAERFRACRNIDKINQIINE